jgi:hypothetical protein
MVQRRYVLITFSNPGNLHAWYYKDNCFRFCTTVSQSLSLSGFEQPAPEFIPQHAQRQVNSHMFSVLRKFKIEFDLFKHFKVIKFLENKFLGGVSI